MSDNGDHIQDRDSRGPRDPDNDPPYSRVFVVCGKGTSEEELNAEFKPYGHMQYCKLIKDKSTGESKNIAYVKYDKASAAALAIEALNGKKITEDQPALKVLIADAKGTRSNPRSQSREPEDMPPRSRLFVICSKDYAEEDISSRFKPYGDIEYCKVIKDKQSSESKGYAYVKFTKSSSAAMAMEEVNRLAQDNGLKLKALVADPKSKSKPEPPLPPVPYPSIPVMYDQPMPFPYPPELASLPGYSLSGYLPQSRQRLFVVCHKTVTQEQLSRLFSRFPGMEYCDLKKNKQTGESKGFAYINYSTPQAALMAKDQMDGYEYPAGNALKVMFAEPLGVKQSMPAGPEPPSISSMRDSFAHMMSPYPPIAYPPPHTSHAPAPPMSPSDNSSKGQSNDRNYPEGSRLFIILSKAVPDYLLQDQFSRFGALEYVRLQKDKNYGYAKYTTAAAANYAMTFLNNTEIQGQKITVTLAHPPNSDSRKRPNMKPDAEPRQHYSSRNMTGHL